MEQSHIQSEHRLGLWGHEDISFAGQCVFASRHITIYYLCQAFNIPLTHCNFEFILPTFLISNTPTTFEKYQAWKTSGRNEGSSSHLASLWLMQAGPSQQVIVVLNGLKQTGQSLCHWPLTSVKRNMVLPAGSAHMAGKARRQGRQKLSEAVSLCTQPLWKGGQ